MERCARSEPDEALSRWQIDTNMARERMYRAPTARERERWHAVWLALQGWPASQVAAALRRDPHTVGQWLLAVRQAGPAGLAFIHTGGCPPR